MTIDNVKRILGDSPGSITVEARRTWPSRRCAESSARGLRARPAAPVMTSLTVGTLCAVVFLELLSRQFTSNLGSLERPSPAASFKPDPAAVEETYKVRWCSEGCATSHFSRDGARVTQNPILTAAPTAVILGDSHVEAFQVSDALIAGSVVERLARAEGNRINVRHYGWSAASIPV